MNESILIVDDSALNRRLLGSILEREDFRISEADCGQEAIRMALEVNPDLVLLDLMMPDLDGFEVLRRLRSAGGTLDTPVILVSALEDASNKIKGLDMGADDYITKPFDKGETLARVRAHLRIRQLNRALLDKQAQLDQDLAAAADIQRSLMPKGFEMIGNLEISSRFRPCEGVGGDLVNVVRLDEHHVAFFVVDVSGHGVPAAMITVAVAQSLSLTGGVVVSFGRKGTQLRIRRPVEVFAELEKLFPFERFRRHFTISYMVLDLRNGRLRYACAGHPPPILQRPGGLQTENGSFRLLEAGGPVIGLGDLLPHEEGEVELATGDRVYLYTDGIVEHQDGERKTFGVDGLLRSIAGSGRSCLKAVCTKVIAELEKHGGRARFRDDVSLLAFELLDPGPVLKLNFPISEA